MKNIKAYDDDKRIQLIIEWFNYCDANGIDKKEIIIGRNIYSFLISKGMTFVEYIKWVEDLYLNKGYSAQMIVDELAKYGYPLTPRSMQRFIGKLGFIRTVKESFNNAIKTGRMDYKSRKRKE